MTRPSLEQQLGGYAEMVRELDRAGRFDRGPHVYGGDQPRRGVGGRLLLTCTLVLFVVVLISGVTVLARRDGERRSLDNSDSVEQVELGLSGGTVCGTNGLCVTVTAQEHNWLVAASVAGSGDGATSWTSCSQWKGLSYESGTNGVSWMTVPADTPRLEKAGFDIRQLRVQLDPEHIVSVLAVTGGASLAPLVPDLQRYAPDPAAMPEKCVQELKDSVVIVDQP